MTTGKHIGIVNFDPNKNMEFYASGKKGFYQPNSSYQPNIDAGLLAHVREEVFKREEEQRRQRRIDEARKTEDEKRSKLGGQIRSIITNLPMYVKRITLQFSKSVTNKIWNEG